jgi:hypothetical protein
MASDFMTEERTMLEALISLLVIWGIFRFPKLRKDFPEGGYEDRT